MSLVHELGFVAEGSIGHGRRERIAAIVLGRGF